MAFFVVSLMVVILFERFQSHVGSVAEDLIFVVIIINIIYPDLVLMWCDLSVL